jgi:arsenate reductase
MLKRGPKQPLTNCSAKTKQTMLTLYGIPNCDKCRAARKWFAASGADFRFHDLRADGIDLTTIERWLIAAGDAVLINRRSTTWRSLSVDQREGLDAAGNAQLLLENPTLLKRPLVEQNETLLVGYDEERWQTLING